MEALSPLTCLSYQIRGYRGAPDSQKEPIVDRSYSIGVESKNGGFRRLMGASKTVQKRNVFYTG
jgi:hypothetical protein